MTQESFRLIACPHIFSSEKGRIDVMRPPGGTVADIMRSIGWTHDRVSARVYLDGVLVKDAAWEYTKPCAGQSLAVRAIPMGGSSGGKDIGRMVAMIAVIAVAMIVMPGVGVALAGTVGLAAYGSAFGAAAVAVTSIVGTLAVSALIPPPKPKMDALSGQTGASNTLSLTGTSNQASLYGTVPRVYGLQRVFPNLAARQYTEVVGDDQYLRALFCFGPGPLELSDFRIGSNSIGLFQDVQIQVNQGYPTDTPHTLYPASVTEDPFSIQLITGVNNIRTSKDASTELSIDITIAGLWLDFPGGPRNTAVAFLVEYRLQGTTPWIAATGRIPVQASLTTALAGTNNDLTFAELGSGSEGANNYSIAYVDQPGTGPPVGPLIATHSGDSQFAFAVGIRLIGGVYPSAAQVLGFLRGASFQDTIPPFRIVQTAFTSVLSVTLAAGNNGAGRVSPMPPTRLSGGASLVPSLAITDTKLTQFKKSITWNVPVAGTYDIQVTKIVAPTGDVDPAAIHDISYWTALRSIRGGIQLIPVGMASVAMRIRATDQLNGTIDSFNATAHSILLDWDGGDWILRTTNNPASIFRDVHQGTANARPKPDSLMDLPTLQGFHDRCVANGFEFNANIDYRSTVDELGRDVLAAGRATPGYRDGKVSCTEDIPQTIPVTILTPRNSFDYKATKVFTDIPHALRARFANADTLQQDELVVIADGYGVTGADLVRRDAFGVPTSLPEATNYEAVEAGVGVNNTDQIFKIWRYNLAVQTLRPETYSVSCDFEHLIMRPGDLIAVQHDVPLFSLISGRITGVTTDELARTTTITLDEPCTMEDGERYGIRMRLQDGTQIQREVLAVAGEHSTLTFLEPV